MHQGGVIPPCIQLWLSQISLHLDPPTCWVWLHREDCCSTQHLPAWLVIFPRYTILHLPNIFGKHGPQISPFFPLTPTLDPVLTRQTNFNDFQGEAMDNTKTPPKSPSKSPHGSKPASPTSASPPGQGPALSPSGILPAEHWVQQEPVPDDDESALGESNISSTASVASSILNYRTLHGRRYHSEIGNAYYWYYHLIFPLPLKEYYKFSSISKLTHLVFFKGIQRCGAERGAGYEVRSLQPRPVRRYLGALKTSKADDKWPSHHAITLACEDKLFLAPIEKDKVQVCRRYTAHSYSPALTGNSGSSMLGLAQVSSGRVCLSTNR